MKDGLPVEADGGTLATSILKASIQLIFLVSSKKSRQLSMLGNASRKQRQYRHQKALEKQCRKVRISFESTAPHYILAANYRKMSKENTGSASGFFFLLRRVAF